MMKQEKKQVKRLGQIKNSRSFNKVKASLTALERGAKGKANLLELAIEAARNRATLGEISQALEHIFGRYKAGNQTISGVYSSAIKGNDFFKEAQILSEEYSELEGRRPRILIAKMGQDGHDRGAKVIASSFADLGFDVDIGSLFQTPEEVAKQAVENDVHLVGISSLAGGHMTFIPQLIKKLEDYGRDDIFVVAGGIIPQQDHEALYARGVLEIFGPGTVISKAAIKILKRLMEE